MANYEGLKKNVIYVLKESQIKIGYTENAVTLNYPLDSLNRLMETECNFEEMGELLKGFCEYAKTELGEIKTSVYEGKYSLKISKEGVRYVHENIKDSGFLTEFINLLKEHKNITIEEVLQVFNKYSSDVKCIDVNDNEEFNYIVYFEGGKPDEFIYCIDIDLGHATYHRLTKGDFKAFGFESYLKK